MCSYYDSCFFKKDCSYRNNSGIHFHDGDSEHSLMKEKNRSSYVILPSGIPDLALGTLKMLFCVYFRDVLQS